MSELLSPGEFEKLYREHYTRLFYYAYDFMNDNETSRDIVANVFARLWSNIGSVKKQGIESYLKVCVRNECVNLLRKEKTREKYMKYVKASMALEDTDEPWQVMEERLQAMENAIANMSEKTRFALEQCALHSHTYKEVAEMMGITPDAVKSHITRAYAILREVYHIKKVKK